jgi:hypothetical protein
VVTAIDYTTKEILTSEKDWKLQIYLKRYKGVQKKLGQSLERMKIDHLPQMALLLTEETRFMMIKKTVERPIPSWSGRGKNTMGKLNSKSCFHT